MPNRDFLLEPKHEQNVLLTFLSDLFIGILFALFIVLFIGQSFIIIGPSMEPTLFSDDRVIAEKVSYNLHEPRRFDIVIFKEPSSNKTLVKRVIGLPGEIVEFKNGKTYINNKLIKEQFIKAQDTSFDGNKFSIPEGKIFVLGDNRPISRDSRYFDAIPIANIRGRAFLVYWKNIRLLH